MDDHVQALYNIIAILTDRLGGKVEITFDEVDNPPVAELSRDTVANKVTIKVARDKPTNEK